ncbi:glycerophosphoryl diester phosphodiesterase membrane domain-containing protein [Microbacterium sp. NPDC089695]|uniref:glycerophosphoryl diester phosphodiesterase membrane domain-containing protein n=1 Tax=Microbacterium sp. NPDC089695 TaxID=3364198 RepID=UPI00382CA7A5
MTGQTWTPAPKKGIIPLHPLTFGMLLGRSFSALRHNPKVLFGFGVVIQLAVLILSTAVMAFVFATTFARLESLSPSSPDFEAVFAGTIGMNLVAGIVVGLASIAFTALMQGIVAAEIGNAALGVKASLGALWKKMIPAFWRLVGFASLFVAFVFGVMLILFLVVAGAIAGGLGGSVEAISGLAIIVILLFLAMIPLVIWLSTKLLLVPSILVLERARFRAALVRSWRLTRGRFWVAFGVTILIGIIMGLAMQVVNLPVALLGTMLGSVVAPTGSPDAGSILAFVFALLAPQILLLVLQAITLVVQSSAGTLIYLDCRMRYEGLDQALISHVERRDLGWTEEQLGDPFVVDPGRAVTSAPPPKQTPEWAAGAAYAVQPYPGQQYQGQQYQGQQPYPSAQPQPYPYAQQQYAQQHYQAPQPPYAQTQPSPPPYQAPQQPPYAQQQPPSPAAPPQPPAAPPAYTPPPASAPVAEGGDSSGPGASTA